MPKGVYFLLYVLLWSQYSYLTLDYVQPYPPNNYLPMLSSTSSALSLPDQLPAMHSASTSPDLQQSQSNSVAQDSSNTPRSNASAFSPLLGDHSAHPLPVFSVSSYTPYCNSTLSSLPAHVADSFSPGMETVSCPARIEAMSQIYYTKQCLSKICNSAVFEFAPPKPSHDLLAASFVPCFAPPPASRFAMLLLPLTVASDAAALASAAALAPHAAASTLLASAPAPALALALAPAPVTHASAPWPSTRPHD